MKNRPNQATQPDETEETFTFSISEADADNFKRLDLLLANKIPHLSRTFIKNLFEAGLIEGSFNQQKIPLSIKKIPPLSTQISVLIPPPIPSEISAENIPLEIIFEDEHLVIVNKPAGLVTHPAPGNYTGTLVNAILYHCPDLKGVGNVKRPGIVHRLDKGTSGLMVVAKEQKCHEGLILLFSKHDIQRKYQALAMGKDFVLAKTIDSTIGRHPKNRLKMAANVKDSKQAITHIKLIKQYSKFAHVQCQLETGRTHQIRVHLSQLENHPILCDPLYGNPKEHLQRLGKPFQDLIGSYPYPFLHAKILGFIHPITKKEVFFEIDPPELFKHVLALGEING